MKNFLNKLAQKKGEDPQSLQARGEQCLNDALVCLTNDAATIELRMKAMQIKCEEGLRLLRQAFGGREKQLPHQHIDIATNLLIIAVTLDLQDKGADADPLYERATNGLLHDRPGADTATRAAIQRLLDSGKLIRLDGPFDFAEQLHRRAVSLAGKLLDGPDALAVQSSFDLAVTLDAQGKSEAQALYDKVLAIKANHLAVSSFLANMATAYAQLGRLDPAESLFVRALAVREAACGLEHEELLSLLQSYADFLSTARNDHARETALYERASTIAENKHGTQHPAAAALFVRTGMACMMAEQFEKAIEYYRKALPVRQQEIGEQNIQFARELRCLAGCHAMLDQCGESEELFVRTLSIMEALPSAPEPEIVDVAMSLAAIYCEQSKFAQAKPLLERFIERSERTLGADSEATEKLKMLLEETNATAQ